MNSNEPELLKGVLALGAIVGGGILLSYLLEEDPKPRRRATKSLEGKKRNRPERTLTREKSDSEKSLVEDRLGLTENQVPPKREDNSASRISRSEKYSPSVTSLTSKKNLTSTVPVKVSSGETGIRKYPDYYYKLSQKAQWKFRKHWIPSIPISV